MHELVIRGGTVVDGTGAPAVTADVAVDGVASPPSGRSTSAGERELDADGLVVAPGWVDIHTHYDGQVTWDPEVTPSSWHGVTTVVMGNCGVGFAPVRPGAEGFLIELMEGVEDIPGTALHEGIDVGLGELPAVPRRARQDAACDRRRRPGAARRAARLRDGRARPRARGRRRRDRRDVEARRGRPARRRLRHQHQPHDPAQLQHGLVPGTDAPPEELLALGDAIGRAGHGVFQLVSDHQGGAGDRAWLVDLVERTGATATYALAQAPYAKDAWRDALAAAAEDRAAGRRIIPQVACRPTGMLFGLQSSLHPFFTHPTYRDMADLPLAERVRPAVATRGARRAAGRRARHPQPDRPRAHAAVGADLPARRPARLRAAPLGEHRRRRRARGPLAAGGRPRLAARARRHRVPVRAARQLRRPRPRGAPRDDDRPEHGARPVRRRRPLRADLRREHAHLPAHPLGERSRRAVRASASSRPSACRRRARRRPTASPTAA